MAQLGVNVDHVATVREARKTNEPDPVWAASLAELGGADGITLHLREDRRHIQERDLRILRESVTVKLNLELACDEQVLESAKSIGPDQATLVPERREEVTTEGGLNVVDNVSKISDVVARLQEANIAVSLFLDPDLAQIDAGRATGAGAIELHTGAYANAALNGGATKELDQLRVAGEAVVEGGMVLHAGHGLTYRNVVPVAQLPAMTELNIGHSIVARALMVGFQQAVRDMKQLIV